MTLPDGHSKVIARELDTELARYTCIAKALDVTVVIRCAAVIQVVTTFQRVADLVKSSRFHYAHIRNRSLVEEK